jgi:hypothetical protein
VGKDDHAETASCRACGARVECPCGERLMTIIATRSITLMKPTSQPALARRVGSEAPSARQRRRPARLCVSSGAGQLAKVSDKVLHTTRHCPTRLTLANGRSSANETAVRYVVAAIGLPPAVDADRRSSRSHRSRNAKACAMARPGPAPHGIGRSPPPPSRPATRPNADWRTRWLAVRDVWMEKLGAQLDVRCQICLPVRPRKTHRHVFPQPRHPPCNEAKVAAFWK